MDVLAAAWMGVKRKPALDAKKDGAQELLNMFPGGVIRG